MSAVQVNNVDEKQQIVERKLTASDSSSVLGNTDPTEVEKGAAQETVEENKGHSWTSYQRLRPYILVGLGLLILAWWISSIALPATRHRWYVFQTLTHVVSSRSDPRTQDRADILGLDFYFVGGFPVPCGKPVAFLFLQNNCFPIYPQLCCEQTCGRSLGSSGREAI